MVEQILVEANVRAAQALGLLTGEVVDEVVERPSGRDLGHGRIIARPPQSKFDVLDAKILGAGGVHALVANLVEELAPGVEGRLVGLLSDDARTLQREHAVGVGCRDVGDTTQRPTIRIKGGRVGAATEIGIGGQSGGRL